MGRRATIAVGAALLVWTALLVRELPLGSNHVELYADWDHHLLEAEVAVRSVRDGEAPFWNPYPCGGLPSLAHPLSRVGTPFFLLHLALGASRALRWEIVLHLLLAGVGTALLVSRHAQGGTTCRAAAALLGGMVFSGSSFFALHLTEGHLWMLTGAYLPWVLYCFERGVGRPAFAALAGVLLALMLGEGGALPLPLVTLLLMVYAAMLAARDRSLAPLSALAIASGIAIALGAPKLLPLIEFLQRNPRETLDQMVFPVQAALHALLDRDQALRRSYDWLYWGWQEQGHYVGVGVLLLAAIGSMAAARVSRMYASLALFFLLLALGPFHAIAPWNLVHRLPLFSALHVTSRFLVISVLMLAALGGLGLAALLGRVPSPRARAGIATLALVGIGADLLVVHQGIFGVLGERPCPMRAWPDRAPRGEPIVTLGREPPETRRCRLPGAYVRSAMVPAAREGVAIVRAYSALCPRDRRTDVVNPAALLRRARVPTAATEIRMPRNFGRKPGLHGVGDPEYRGESWVEEGEGTAVISSRSMNAQSLEVETPGPSRIVMNQNWDPGWRADRGRLLQDGAGRLVLEMPGPTRGTIRLRYRPPYWHLGLFLFSLGWLAVGLAFVRERRLHAPPGGAGPDEAAVATPGTRG